MEKRNSSSSNSTGTPAKLGGDKVNSGKRKQPVSPELSENNDSNKITQEETQRHVRRMDFAILRTLPVTVEGTAMRAVLPFHQKYCNFISGPIRKATSPQFGSNRTCKDCIIVVPENVWHQDNFMENIIAMSKKFQSHGAKGVIFQMPNWKLLSMDTIWGKAHTFAVELSRVSFSSDQAAAKDSVTIPVCLLDFSTVDTLSSKPRLSSLNFDGIGDICDFDRGQTVDVVRLSTQLEDHLERQREPESAFSLLSDASHTDFETCFRLLLKRTTSSNFPLTVSLALELGGGKSPPFKQIIEMTVNTLKTYSWSPDCVLFASIPHVRERFGNWVDDILRSRKVNGKEIAIGAFVAIAAFADAMSIKPREQMWDLILPQPASLKNSFKDNELFHAIDTLRTKGRPLNRSEKLRLFPVLSKMQGRLSELDRIFGLGEMNAEDPDVFGVVRSFMCDTLISCLSAGDFIRFYQEFTSYFNNSWRSTLKAEMLGRVRGFSPTDWVIWLKCEAYSDLNIPNLDNAFYSDLQNNSSSRSLSDYIELYALLKGRADRYDDSRFVELLQSRHDRESDPWNSLSALISVSSHPFLVSLSETVLNCAKKLQLAVSSCRVRAQCFSKIYESLGLRECSLLTNELTDVAIASLFAGCLPFEEAGELWKTLNIASASDLKLSFVAKSVERCFKLFKLQDHCSDVISLCIFMDQFLSSSSLEQSLFWRCIATQQKLNRKLNKTCVVIQSISECFSNTSVVPQFDAESLRLIKRQLEKLSKHKEIYNVLFERHVKTTLQAAQTSIELIQEHLPFLRCLNSYVPALVEPFRNNSWFDNDCLMSRVAATVLNQWEEELKKVKSCFQSEDRRFFDYFVVKISSKLSRRSALFRNYLDCWRPEYGWDTMESFVKSLRHVKKFFARLLSLEKPALKFDELLTLGNVLQREVRTASEEVQILSEYFMKNNISTDVVEDLSIVLDLLHWRKPLKSLVGAHGLFHCCGSLGALFDKNVADCQLLTRICNELDDKSIASSWTPDECREKRNQILSLMSANNSNSLLNIISLIEHISKATKLCEFFLHRPMYICEQGEGYSAEFRDKVEDFLSQLGGEEYKLLDAFRTVASWIVYVMIIRNSDFKSFFARLTLSPRLESMLSQKTEENPFLQVTSVEDNMSYINELFQKGLGSLDSVIGQLRSIDLGCAYIFDLSRSQMFMKFEEGGRQRTMKDEEVRDFFQRLGFIQFEDKAIAANVSGHIDKLSFYMKSIVSMSELHHLGHPQWIQETAAVVEGNFRHDVSCHLKVKDFTDLTVQLTEWKAKIEETSRQMPMMSLLSLNSAQNFAGMIKSGDVKGVSEMLRYLLPEFINNSAAIKVLDKHIRSIHESAPPDWLEILSRFGQKYFPIMAQPSSNVITNTSPTRYASPPSQLSILTIIAGIFKDCRPMPAQILWCESDTTASSLESFLRRATLYPTKAFVLLSIEKLEFKLQNILLQNFFSKSNHANVHLVESGPSIFQSSSWIPILPFDEFSRNVNYLDILRRWSQVGNCINNQKSALVFGPPGSGKTYQIKKTLDSRQSRPPLILGIFEGFTLKSIVVNLREYFLEVKRASASIYSIVIQINLGKFKRSLKTQWVELMNRVNRFLFELLVLHCVEDPSSGLLVNLPCNLKCHVMVELPDISGHLEDHGNVTTMHYLPALQVISNVIDAAVQPLDILSEARHVTKYLLAFENGSIDHLYGANNGPKDVMIVLDNSGSMGGGRLETCVRCILNDIFQSRITPNDKLGLIVFNSSIEVHTPLDLFGSNHRAAVASRLSAIYAGGGTNMWTALKAAILRLQQDGRDNKWIVALTDGEAGDYDVASEVSALLRSQALSVRMLFITVGLEASHEAVIHRICIRDTESGDALIKADQSAQSIADAWKEVGERLTVSQRIEKEGENITDAESNRLLRKYMKLDGRNKHWSRLHQRFWINYMYRRCGILASSERFNKNSDLPGFGGLTMSVMLGEVEQALATDFSIDWNSACIEQMVYSKFEKRLNGKVEEDYRWSVLCSDPDNTCPDWRARKELLVKLKMTIPTAVDLKRDDRKVLDSYLATGLGIPLENARIMRSSSGANFDFPMGSLTIIDDHKFVLTLDFVMKLLIMNERIECGIPCIMEGETGVSKTALTRMLFILKNQRNKPSPLASLIRDVNTVHLQQDNDFRRFAILQALIDHWELGDNENIETALNDKTKLVPILCSVKDDLWAILQEELVLDPSLDPLVELSEDCLRSPGDAGNIMKVFEWYLTAIVSRSDKAYIDWTFYPINVHAALTAEEIETSVNQVVCRIHRMDTLSNLLSVPEIRNIKMCIFFDEINTSNCMGLLKEIIVDRTLFGRPLPSNLVVIAACNPFREKFVTNDRRSELGAEWIIGHYQVHPLPASLQQMTWDYGSLKPAQEKEFISKRLIFMKGQLHLTKEDIDSFASLIFEAHQLIRKLAKDHLGNMDGLGGIKQRAGSAVSLRDILRVFQIFSFLVAAPKIQAVVWFGSKKISDHAALMLAIAAVYYLRLGTNKSRKEADFRRIFRAQFPDIENLLAGAMDRLINETILEPGIAKTAGLKENIFMVVLCCLSRVPLMIVGPPGSSKTLAVTIITDNARGEYSKKPFYCSLPTLIPFHYQCSRQSTSTQIKEVFERAIDRQVKADKEGQNILCFVFMDEAGLPEEERESLKVIHYYLEGHTNFGAKVGFVAISNHVLDAAKANRCAALTRTKPDHEELMNIARGCMGSDEERNRFSVKISARNRFDEVVSLKLQPKLGDRFSVLDILCDRYEACVNEAPGTPTDFVEFFGLRDFMHFMKLLGRNCRGSTLLADSVQAALERNFNGAEGSKTKEIIDYFLGPFEESRRNVRKSLTNPMLLFLDAVNEQALESLPVSRYILVIETTTSDAILRVLRNHPEAMIRAELLKLGWFSDDSDNQEVNFISRVRWAAEKGKPALLSNSERVNESFYDLFNQHFRKYEERSAEGEIEVVYHTNIALGSHSRRCKVTPGFQCILHITLEELQLAPAPFLNRFEKYRLTLADILYGTLEKAKTVMLLPELRDVIGPAINHLYAFVDGVGRMNFVGFEENQTIESAILLLLSNWKSHDAFCNDMELFLMNVACRESIRAELGDDELFDELFVMGHPSSSRISKCSQAIAGAKQRRLHCVLISQAIVHFGLQRLLDIVLPEKLLSLFSSLPASLTSDYLDTPHHFSLVQHTARKEVVFMRSCEDVIRLPNEENETLIIQLSEITRQCLAHFRSNQIKKRLVVLVDSTQTSVVAVNFFRSEVDAMFCDSEKLVTILIHIPYSDIGVHHCYASTFDQDWGCRFCDAVHGVNTVTQLKHVYSRTAESCKLVETFLDSLLREWIQSCISLGAQFVPSNAKDVVSLDDMRSVLTALTQISFCGIVIEDVIFVRFKKYWQDDSGICSLIQEQFRKGIRDATDGEIQQGLFEAMTVQLRTLFERFVQYFFLSMLQDISPKVLIELKDLALKRFLFDGIKTLPVPPLAELSCSHFPTELRLSATESNSFTIPFFALVSRYLTALASQTNLVYSSYEEEDVWEQILANMTEKIRSSLDPLAQFVNHHFVAGVDGTLDQNVFLQYLDCQIALELGEAMSIQKLNLLKSWVLSMEALQKPYSKILAIHAGLDWNKVAFRALAEALTPLDGLVPCDMILGELNLAIEGNEADSVVKNINELMVEVCFDTLRGVSSEAELMNWRNSMTDFNLMSILQQGTITAKAEEVIVAYLIAKYSLKDPLQSALTFENELRTLPLQERVSLKSLPLHKLEFCVLYRTVRFFLSTTRCHELDFQHILDICNSSEFSVFESYRLFKVIPLKEEPRVIRQHDFSPTLEVSPVGRWIKKVESVRVIDRILVPKRWTGEFIPLWLDNAENRREDRITDVLFYDACKELTSRIDASTLSFRLLVLIAEELQCIVEANSSLEICRIALGACRLAMIYALAGCILSENRTLLFEDEIDVNRFVGQVESLRTHQGWHQELISIIAMSNPTGKRRARRHLLDLIGSTTIVMLSSWLQGIVNGLHSNRLMGQQRELSFPFLRQNIFVVAQDQLANASELVRGHISRRQTLRLLWVVVDLMNIYEWLSNEFRAASIPANQAKTLKIRSVIDGADSNWKLVWNRVKEGVNACLDDQKSPLPRLCDDLSIWNLLSSDIRDDEPGSFRELLHLVLGEIATVFIDIIERNKHPSRANVIRESYDSWNKITEINVALLQEKQLVDEKWNEQERDSWFNKELERHLADLDNSGELQALLQLCFNSEKGTFDFKALENDLLAMYQEVPFESSMLRKRLPCRFIIEHSIFEVGGVTSFGSFQLFHNLDYGAISKLRELMLWVQEQTQDKPEQFESIQVCFDQFISGQKGSSLLEFLEEEQRLFLLSLPLRQLSSLLSHLQNQLDSGSFQFAGRSLDLKLPWPNEVGKALAALIFQFPNNDVDSLEACLVKYENQISANVGSRLDAVLVKCFSSDGAMHKRYPLLKRLLEATDSVEGFELLCGHYVQLRIQLQLCSRELAKQSRDAAMDVDDQSSKSVPLTLWQRPFLFASDNQIMACDHEAEQILQRRFLPWFLLHSMEELAEREAAQREETENSIKNAGIIRIQALGRGHIVRKLRLLAMLKEEARMKNMVQPSRNGQGGRGRSGRGRGRGSVDSTKTIDVVHLAEKEAAKHDFCLNLSKILRQTGLTWKVLSEIREALGDSIVSTLDKNDLIQKARDRLKELEKALFSVEIALRSCRDERPPKPQTIRSSLQYAETFQLPADNVEVERTSRFLREIEELLQRQEDLIGIPWPSLEDIEGLCSEMKIKYLVPDERLLDRKQHIESECSSFLQGLSRFFGTDENKTVSLASAFMNATDVVMETPQDEKGKNQYEKLLRNLHGQTTKSDVIEAIAMLRKPPLSNWSHCELMLALANSLPFRFELFEDDCRDALKAFCDKTMPKTTIDGLAKKRVSPLLLLVASRLSEDDPLFRSSCLRRCSLPALQAFLTNAEKAIALQPIEGGSNNASQSEPKAALDPLLERWESLKKRNDFVPSAAMEELMALIGMKAIKEKLLKLYEAILNERALPADRRVPRTYNFALLGNPGTGKTTVGKLLTRVLHDLGVRGKADFKETTGEKLARMGADAAEKLLNNSLNGTLFIDEAYALDPARNADAAAVAMQLLDAAESHRTELTIILAGYKQDMESKLFDFNDGFSRRFPYVLNFEDYNEQELGKIFESMCSTRKWRPENPAVVSIAAKRLARGSCRKNFGNAGAVRVLFETTYERALTRDPRTEILTITDVLGPPPDRSKVSDLGVALDELDSMIGLTSVKNQVHRLADMASKNYERELRGEAPHPVALNRVFLGNPGTGKTTVAKLYGRILKGLGLLSDGSWELKQPSDLLGAAVGETQRRTTALLDRCMGKVLIIDEAYGLHGPSYGGEALDTLVGKIHGAPGEDIAVVMIGYEKQMKRMFREMNPGLTRRFALEEAFQFADYSSVELEEVTQRYAKRRKVKLPGPVREKFIKALVAERSRPNFGNAGRVETLMSRALERMSTSRPLDNTLTLTDFGLEKADSENPFAPLQGLYKIDHIESKLRGLHATLKQCEIDGKDPSEFLPSYLFMGNPGTGKTTVARAMASILHGLGVLGSNNIVVKPAQDLQGSYVGQTKDKVNETMAEAQGGVLFIDEAYTLGGHAYAQEAVDQLVALMTEPEHKNKTVVILAGYTREMEAMLSSSNSGLRSRFQGRIDFPDWDASDCMSYLKQKCQQEGIALGVAASKLLLNGLLDAYRRPGWANARDCETMYRFLYEERSLRCLNEVERNGAEFTEDDAENAMRRFLSQRPLEKVIRTVNLPAFPMNMANPPVPPPVERKTEAVVEDEDTPVVCDEAEIVDDVDGDDPAFAALLEACREAGYDTSHEKRIELIAILEGVESQSSEFPPDIIDRVCRKTRLTAPKATKILRPQVHRVLGGMRNAVEVEEARREELRRLEEEERKAKEREHEQFLERLRLCGPCPMGYSWHPCGQGMWRCAGGSHFVSTSQLPYL